MTKNEVITLMENIKVFYHNFSFPPDLVQAWYDRLKDMPYEVAKGNLDRYVEEDEMGRTPTLARILKTTRSTGIDEWKWYRENMVLKYHDDYTFEDQNGYLWAYPNNMEEVAHERG